MPRPFLTCKSLRSQGAGVAPKSKGEKDALLLVLDLTGLTSEANFDEAFLIWRQRITEDPALWRNGFSLDLIRVRLRDFLDRHGEAILRVIRS